MKVTFVLLQVFRAWKGSREEMRNLRNPKFSLNNDEKCCAEKAKVSVLVLKMMLTMMMQERKGKYLVMGRRGSRPGDDLKPTFIVPWSKSKVRRRIQGWD